MLRMSEESRTRSTTFSGIRMLTLLRQRGNWWLFGLFRALAGTYGKKTRKKYGKQESGHKYIFPIFSA